MLHYKDALLCQQRLEGHTQALHRSVHLCCQPALSQHLREISVYRVPLAIVDVYLLCHNYSVLTLMCAFDL